MSKRPAPLADDDRLDAPLPIGTLEPLVRELHADAAADPILPAVSAAALERRLPRRLPREGVTIEAALDELRDVAVRGRRRNAHPGFFGYVCSPGLPTDAIAHGLVGALNQNVTGFHAAPGAATIERTLIAWLMELVGMPTGADGLLLSGGSLANATAAVIAVQSALGPDVARQGLAAIPSGRAPCAYATREAHFSIARAMATTGIGRDRLREIETDEHRRMVPAALERAILDDRDAGLTPTLVVASAGTTLTGAIDPLDEVSDVCGRHGVWLHADAAYGGAALLSGELRPRLRGLARADSLVLDLHKWFYAGFDASALIVRQPMALRQTFLTRADYVQLPANPDPDSFTFFDFGPETSRRFRALGPYLAFRHYGADRLGRNVAHNVACVEYLAARVEAHPELDLVAPPQLSICCFRYRPEDAVPAAVVDDINTRIRDELEREGAFYLSPTAIEGRAALRLCVIGHATRASHIDALIERVLELGRAAVGAGRCSTGSPVGGS